MVSREIGDGSVSGDKKSRRNWSKLSNIFKSIMLIKRTDTKHLDNPVSPKNVLIKFALE